MFKLKFLLKFLPCRVGAAAAGAAAAGAAGAAGAASKFLPRAEAA
jgi:hypothetical protein